MSDFLEIVERKKILLDGNITLDSLKFFSESYIEAGFNIDELIKFLNGLCEKFPDRYEIPFELGNIFAAKGELYNSALLFGKSLDLSPDDCLGNDIVFYLFNTVENVSERFSLMSKVAMSDVISNQLRYKIFYEMTYLNFLGKGCDNSSSILNDIFFKVLGAFGDKKIQHDFDKKQDESKHVVLLPSQFLGPLHGPTQTTLVIANELVEMGYEPMIIASNPVQFDKKYQQPSSHFHPNILTDYNNYGTFHIGESEVEYGHGKFDFSTIINKGNEYPFVHIDSLFDEKINVLITLLSDFINKNTPIIAIGSPNIHAEVIARYTDVYMLPCSFSLPMTKFCHSIVCRKILKEELEFTNFYKHELIESRFPYGLRFDNKIINKSNIVTDNLKDIVFCFVGGRLELEVDSDMMVRLAKIHCFFPNAKYKFIGIDGSSSLINKLSEFINIDNCKFTGFVSDIKTELLECHFYLNPKRSGGGTSVLEALSLSIPALCYKSGDGYYTAGEFFSFDDDDDLVMFINKYIDDSDFRELSKSECEKSFVLNTDIKKIIKDLTRGKLS